MLEDNYSEIREMLFECFKNDVKTLQKHAKTMKISQHTLIKFLQGTHNPSRITLNRITDYIKKGQAKIKREERKERHMEDTPISDENVRLELIDVFKKFNRSAQEWAHDMGIPKDYLVNIIFGTGDITEQTQEKVKNYLKAIKLVIKLMDKVRASNAIRK